METWYGGGLGRAQGGYDEMVFRAMVRDEATFYDPLGLVSKGTEVDFQSGANAYLYGTRFMSYLALQYTPEKLIDWLRRADGTERYYARDFERVYGKPLPEAWQDWIRWEHEFQEANLEGSARAPDHAVQGNRASRTRRDLALVLEQGQDDAVRRGSLRRAGCRISSASTWRPARSPSSPRSRAPFPYRVTSLAYDPDGEKLFYTTDNLHVSQPRGEYDIKTGESTHAVCTARASATSPTIRSTVRSGDCAPTTAS